MVIARVEIWWAELPGPAGSSPGYRRPVVIMQSNQFNRSGINTVVVVAITSNTKLANAPGNVFLPKTHTSLPQDSVANVSQLLTIDKVFLTHRVATLPLVTFSVLQMVSDWFCPCKKFQP